MKRITTITALLCPGVALACALPASIIMTLPTGYYMAGAAVTVAVTGLLAAAPDRLPKFAAHNLMARRGLVPVTVTSYAAWVLFMGLLLIGFIGARDPMHNLLTLIVWTGVWVALPMGCMIFGNLWRAVNPWTAPIRLTRTILGRSGGVGLSRFGHWPAVAGLLGFFWFYIVSLSPEDPQTLAQAALIYWLVIFGLGVAEGEDWLDEGEFLTVYLTFLSKVAPLWLDRSGPRAIVKFGWPGTQILGLAPLSASAVAFVTLALAGLSFDGLSATFWWLALIGENPLEFTGRSAVTGVNTAGLLATWALTAAAILLALRLGPLLAREPAMMTSAGTMHAPSNSQSPSLMPVMLSFLAIAAGYHSAHYLTTLLTSGQYILASLNDPFFRGDDWLGLPPFYVSMGFLTDRWAMTMIWNSQFVLIVGAHVLAVILALRLSPADLPARAHLPLTTLMIGYTLLGLWLLSSPTGY
jgi:hypothetical protein